MIGIPFPEGPDMPGRPWDDEEEEE